ncbi:hypothetical protein EDD85DRAFT_955130 [Armillaria nabsnona]|nr:hypothetical protein EDD85DRAFT_955130 [Armillaria nabsnona]
MALSEGRGEDVASRDGWMRVESCNHLGRYHWVSGAPVWNCRKLDVDVLLTKFPPVVDASDIHVKVDGRIWRPTVPMGLKSTFNALESEQKMLIYIESPVVSKEGRRRRIVYISRRSLQRYIQDIEMYGCNMENTFDSSFSAIDPNLIAFVLKQAYIKPNFRGLNSNYQAHLSFQAYSRIRTWLFMYKEGRRRGAVGHEAPLVDSESYVNTYLARTQVRLFLERLPLQIQSRRGCLGSDFMDSPSFAGVCHEIPHRFLLTTRTAQIYTTESSWYNHSLAPHYVIMDHEETSVERWERFKGWWDSKKQNVSYLWREKKRSVSESFAHSRVSLWYDKVRKSPPIYHQHPNLLEITLSAILETGQAESTIPVLRQRSYTDNQPVISSALADTPCADLGIDGVLERLNGTLGTSYTLGSKILRLLGITTLHLILKPYIERNDDFGTVYAHLRPDWYQYSVAAIQHKLRSKEEEDREIRRKALVHDRITTRWVHPRRVWDLCANRVVPYWVANENLRGTSHAWPWGISHAWVDVKDRVNAMTPINGYEWPVPMPKDTNLNLIRIEMLNLGAQYTWLDILCLRQEGGKGEHLRVDEWKLDVPTIGWVYWGTDVVCYFNGLGRPLNLTPDYFESDRCWFRRAWTLQEIPEDPIIGGETGDDVMDKEVRKTFDEKLARLQEIQKQNMALELVSEMQIRVSTKPLDKVAGLAYPLLLDSIPIYDAEMSDKDAWEALMDAMSPVCRAEFFFYFPEPGNGNKCWRPSWEQIMMIKHIVPYSLPRSRNLHCTEDTDEDWYEGYFIDSAYVQGLAEGLTEEKPRQGQMDLQDAAGLPHTLTIVATHTCPIPDGLYALIGYSFGNSSDVWVVGW